MNYTLIISVACCAIVFWMDRELRKPYVERRSEDARRWLMCLAMTCSAALAAVVAIRK